MSRAKRTDANQAEIVAALREVGASVHCAHAAGGGFPDLVVGIAGETFLLETKTASGSLNARQRKWHQGWRGHAVVVRDVNEALAAVGKMKQEE